MKKSEAWIQKVKPRLLIRLKYKSFFFREAKRLFRLHPLIHPIPVSYTHLDVYKRQGIDKTPVEQTELTAVKSGIGAIAIRAIRI